MNDIIPIQIENNAILDQDEIKQLIYLSQNGCENSRKLLVERNIKLVLNVAHRFKRYGYVLEDLFQIGSIGLIKAIDNFDLSRNVKFSTYAVPMILGEIRRYLRDNHSMKVSRSLKDTARKIIQFKEEFIVRHQREPRVSDIEEGIGITKEEAVMALEASSEILSLSTPVHAGESGDDEICLEDRLSDSSNWEREWEKKETLREAFTQLEEKERVIIQMRYYQDKTQSEIGKTLGVSQAHVSRIEKAALEKLKHII